MSGQFIFLAKRRQRRKARLKRNLEMDSRITYKNCRNQKRKQDFEVEQFDSF